MMLEQDYRYILEPTTIGRGTFSQTKKATIAIGENQTIATDSQGAIVKTLASHLRELPDFWRFKRRFSKLAHRLCDCQHPHLASVIDCFEEDGQPYVVYEAIAGRSLADILETKGAFPLNLALRYIEQIAGAIATLHNAGLLHLDLSPSNIIQRHDKDEVVVVEFGLTAELTPAIKQTRANLLSPGYAAPEQHQPKAFCTPATDIYALSATLYTLLNGNPPPPAPLLDIIERDRWQHFPSDLPESIKTAILQGLSIDPQQRPQSVQAWQSLLEGTSENLAAESINPVENNNFVTPSIINELPFSEGLEETRLQEVNSTEEVRATAEEQTLDLGESLELESLKVRQEFLVERELEQKSERQDCASVNNDREFVKESFPEIQKSQDEPALIEESIAPTGASDLVELALVEEVLPSEIFGETALQQQGVTAEEKPLELAENVELESLSVWQEIAIESDKKESKIQDLHRADARNPIVEDQTDAYESYNLTDFPALEEVYPSEVLEQTPLQTVSPAEANAAVEEESLALLENGDRSNTLSGLEELWVEKNDEELEIKAIHPAENSLRIEEISVEASENYPAEDFRVTEKVSATERLEKSSLQEVSLAETAIGIEKEITDVAESQDIVSWIIGEEIPDAIATDEPKTKDFHRADGRYTAEKEEIARDRINLAEPLEAVEVRESTSVPIIEEISPSEESEEITRDRINLAESRTTLEAQPIAPFESPDLASFSLANAQQLPELLETSSPSISNGKHALTRKELQSTKMVLWWLSRTNSNPTLLKPKFPMRALLVTCAIAASAGAGLGISVRVNRPEEAGSSVWHLKQSFPPRDAASPTLEEETY
ncbi:serine/threonine-protein kinase [Oscillatoria sp. FACHB-1406]|uniref:serine/threonine-protein kinase n=1 Tax=Oscillatoria sp. FACHB-1406 TaxID=2692846 RepID=UPI00168542C6|nr:serine/threonine-protein kinase [Oscillatoria sp. FACHB-1406]MBD2579121.1 serine/threonine protein kinase [Oscillatoria sp. FACHB-1406]